MYQPASKKGRDSVFEEDAALIAQLLEEDDSWRVAREVQNAKFDGLTHPNPLDKSFKDQVFISPKLQVPQNVE